MKGKFLFLTLAAALLMTACANDEITASRDNEKPDPNSIRFQPVVPYASRAEATTTDNIEEFVTYAYEDGVGVYMDGVTVTKGTSTWGTSPTYYWPDANLSFYSLSPVSYSLTLDETTGTPAAVEFEAAEDPDEQVDFIYAVNMNEEKQETPVPVNFRHALSQVAFKAQNTNTAELKVVIEGIEVDGVAASGAYTLPAATTAYDDASEDTRGSWEVADDHTAKYVALTGAAIELTEDVSDVISDVLYLIPQEDEGWDNVNDKTNENDGSYFSIKCHLSRVLDTNEEIQIWPTNGETYDYVSVPVAVDWEEGYCYTYTIIFGEGMGYYPPDYTNPEDAGDPIPVLTPISFTVTVDEFQEVEKDVSMKADEGETEPTSLEPLNKAYPYYKNSMTENGSAGDASQLADDGTIYDIDEAVARLTELEMTHDAYNDPTGAEIDDVAASGADYAIIDNEGGVFLFKYDEETETFEAVDWIQYNDEHYNFGCVDLASDTEIEYYTESGTYTSDDGEYSNTYSAGDVKYIKLVINVYYDATTVPNDYYLWKVYTREFSMEEIDKSEYNPDNNDEPLTGKLSGTYTSIENECYEEGISQGTQLAWVNPMYTHGAILDEISNVTLQNAVLATEADYGIFDAEGGVFLFKYDSLNNILSDPVWLNSGGSNYGGWGCVGFGEESTVTLDGSDNVVSIYMEIDAYYDATETPDPSYLWKTYYRTFIK